MTLRSRKKDDGSEAAARRADPEGSFRELADEPLRKLEMQNITFSFMFVDFLFKLSCAIVLYCAFYMYSYSSSVQIVGFHSLSALFFASCSLWLTQIKTNGLQRIFSYRSCRVAIALMLGQAGIFTHMYLDGSRETVQCAPISVLYFLLIVGSLYFLNTTSDALRAQRMDLYKDQ